MKIKSETETCGPLTKEHGYLGHFAKSEHLSRGHNSGPIDQPTEDRINDLQRMRSQGLLPSEQERERLSRANSERIKSEAEAEVYRKFPKKEIK